MGTKNNLVLKDGSSVGIIGGGPAGSFFAIELLRLARQKDMDIKVCVFEKKIFTAAGPRGCNMCAGTIGNGLVTSLNQYGLTMPEDVIRQKINGYVLHIGNYTAEIPSPPNQKIYTVFRGGGPLRAKQDSGIKSFDWFLYEEAKKHGVVLINEFVIDVKTGRDGALIETEYNKEKKQYPFDLVVGAFGISPHVAEKFSFGYRPPEYWKTCQTELELGEEYIAKSFGNRIHIFSSSSKKIKYTAFIPKDEFLTISAIGKDVAIDDLKEELHKREIAKFLPDRHVFSCFCNPKIVVRLAENPYSDRCVIIGDACGSRYLKNGIESAFRSGRVAARVAIKRGISKSAFRKKYFPLCRKNFKTDNYYGKILFSIYDFIVRFPSIAGVHFNEVSREQKSPGRYRHTLSSILWNMFIGEIPYYKIFMKAINPSLQIRLFYKTVLKSFRRRGFFERINIFDGVKIAVIGGGPAGAGCALKLLQLSKRKGLKISVRIFEGKDFKIHYNQCVGVLSPPIVKILKHELGIELPDTLKKKQIRNYVLHGDKSQLSFETSKEHGDTYTLRRVEFDEFMLSEAKKQGAEIVDTRVTDVEFVDDEYSDEVRIYCENGYFRADVVVCACGLDDIVLNAFEKATKTPTKYRRPASVFSTIIVKIPADSSFIEERLNDTIHVFVPAAQKKVEFGAVTPKEDHITVNIAGRDVSSIDMDKFLKTPAVRSLLPEEIPWQLEYYKGRFPTSPAKYCFGNRFVVVGDATGWMRPFKGKGINTAVVTGISAAKAIINNGISADAFRSYAKESQEFKKDYIFGNFVRIFNHFIARIGFYDRFLEFARENPALKEMIYYAISGEKSYREILRNALKRGIIFGLGLRLIYHFIASFAAIFASLR